MDYDDLKTKKGREFWGRPTWNIKHCIAKKYNPNQAPYIKKLLKAETLLLPCDECKEHLKINLKSFPPDKYLTDSDTLSFYFYTLHDQVNQQINARLLKSTSPSAKIELKSSPTFDQMMKTYGKITGKCDCASCEFFWVVIHSFSTTYSPEAAQAYVDFIECMCVLFPCDECRPLFCNLVKKNPPNKYLTNNNDVFFWSYIIHQAMNKEQRKDIEDYAVLRNIFFTALKNDCKACSVS